MNKIKYLIPVFLLLVAGRAQTLTVDGQFNEFVTYYISSVDINTGATNVQLFYYELRCDDCDTDDNNRYDPPINVNISFSVSISSPALGLDDEIAYIYTDRPFVMKAPVQIDNRDFTIDAMEIYDIYGEEVSMSISSDDDRTISENQMNDIFSSIVTTGKLPDGVYHLVMDIEAWDDDGNNYNIQCTDNCQKTLTVSTPVSLELVEGSPGGTWDNLPQNEIFTTFPVFNWESDLVPGPVMETCDECGFFIRVAEFRSGDHTSMEDAMEDLTTLPVDQALGWHPVGNQLSLMYPASDAIELYPGGIYVYQVQKKIMTSVGVEAQESPVYAFFISNPEQSANPVNAYIGDIISEETFNQMFGVTGELSGFYPTGTVTLDGETLEELQVIDLKGQFLDQVFEVISLEVE